MNNRTRVVLATTASVLLALWFVDATRLDLQLVGVEYRGMPGQITEGALSQPGHAGSLSYADAVRAQARWAVSPTVAGATASADRPTVRRVATTRGPLDVLADEILVTLRPGVGADALARLADATDTTVRDWNPGLSAARLSFVGDPDELDRIAARVARHPYVTHAGPHAVMRATADHVVVPAPGGDWYIEKGSQNRLVAMLAGTEDDYSHDDDYALPLQHLQWNIHNLELGKAVERGFSGDSIVVAVLDTGVAYEDHADELGVYGLAPDLAHVDFVSPRDVVNDDEHANDDNGHGTQMTTLMAGLGWTLPVAPNVKVMPIKVLDAERIGT